jgi:predicted Zn-dependent peptidase
MSPRITQLPSGLRIVSDTMRDLETASLGVWVNAGARHELPHEHGLSHLLEHMAFKGTTTRSARQIAEDIETAGGELNASTSVEHTAYFARILGQDTPLALDILADILGKSCFDENELSREKDVIIQEIGENLDTPDELVFDLLTQAAYPEQSIGRAILGTPSTIRQLDRAAITSYLDQHYIGPCMVIAAAGAVEHDELVQSCISHFSYIRHETERPCPSAHYVGGQKILDKKSEQSHIAIAFDSVSFHDPKNYAAHIFAQAVGGGMSSRLYQDIREQRGLAYSVYSFQWGYEDTGLFGFYAATSPNDANQLIRVALDGIAQATENLSEVEIQRAKAQIKVSLLTALESPTARIEQMARHVLAFNRVIEREEIIAQIDALTRDDIRAIGKQMIASIPSVAAIGPSSIMSPDQMSAYIS